MARRDCIDFFHVPPEKIIAIPNSAPKISEDCPVDKAFFEFCNTHDCIINVGRLSPEKGQIHLLKAFAEWTKGKKASDFSKENKERRQPGLVFVGDGISRQYLENSAVRFGVDEQVFFCGRKTNPMDYLKKSKIFVLCSNVEGMPNVLVEALQAGLPCIATEGGSREILAPDTDPIADRTSGIDCAEYGILVPVCGRETTQTEFQEQCMGDEISDEESIMAEAMKMLYERTDLQENYRQKSAEALQPLELPLIAQRWKAEFEKVIDKK